MVCVCRAALDALEQELSDALNLPSEGLSGSRWEEVRSWLESAIMDARSEDDLGAKRRLRQMVVTGVTKAQRNVKLWREMNALRRCVSEEEDGRRGGEVVVTCWGVAVGVVL